MRTTCHALRTALCLIALGPGLAAQGQPRRILTLDDLYRLRDVSDPQVSPDGAWVAYTVATPDTAEDKNRSAVWMTSWDGARTVRLTTSKPGEYDELLPAWSPDGKRLVFVSKRRPDFDRDNNWDLYVIDAAPLPGAAPRQLTSFAGPDNDPDSESRPAWSPDGRSIAYLQGGPLQLIYYAVQKLAVIPAAGGTPRILTAALDRNVSNPVWSADGSSILFLLEDDRAVQLARVPAAGGAIERVLDGARVVLAFSTGPDGRIAALAATTEAPPEVFAVEQNGLRSLSRQNDAWLGELRLGAVEPVSFRSRDGTPVNGFVVKPPDDRSPPGGPHPALLRIHGRPA